MRLGLGAEQPLSWSVPGRATLPDKVDRLDAQGSWASLGETSPTKTKGQWGVPFRVTESNQVSLHGHKSRAEPLNLQLMKYKNIFITSL